MMQESGRSTSRVTWRTLAVGAALFVVVAAVVAWFLWERCGLSGCPDVERLDGYVPDEASIVVDRSGAELHKLYRVRRVVVPLDSLPPYVPQAFIAVEDQRFFEHGGVDWPRVIGAAWANVRAKTIVEGFSTITMQLARNVFPDRLPYTERTLSRKLAEMKVAREIEARYSKEQILELYLNQIYYGNGAWGIEAAAREYFGKGASELTLAEAALLAGVIRSPNHLDPRRNPEGARARRSVVLAKMAAQGMISGEEAARAAAEPLRLDEGEQVDGYGRAPYFVEEVRRFLEAELGEGIYTGGYTIHTTLDGAAQAVAEEELARQLAAVGGGGALQGAVVVLDPLDGDVLAMVGGRDFAESKFNRATQARRQPGSAFKPIVYAAALSAGLPPTHPLSDAPLAVSLGNGRVWTPRNFGGSYAGVVTMRDALVHSRNVATVRLAEEVGLARVIELARELGLSGPIPAVPSIAIGAAEVTLLELVTAYAVFATLGTRPLPRLVTRIEDREGRVVWRGQRRVTRALDPAVAFLIVDMMKDVVDRGTGTAVRGVGFAAPAAGKTGTTNDNTDVWFIGFTPSLVAGVWLGFDDPRPIAHGATGGRLAAPVWGRIMRRIGAGGGDWAPPAGVETRHVTADGRLLGPGCPADGAVRVEYFLAGTAPLADCGIGTPWYDTLPPDTLGVPATDEGDDEGGWWSRMRRRLFGGGRDTAPPDTGLVRLPSTPERELRDSAPGRDGGERRPRSDSVERDDDPPKLLGRPAPDRGRPTPPSPERRPERSDTADGSPRPR